MFFVVTTTWHVTSNVRKNLNIIVRKMGEKYRECITVEAKRKLRIFSSLALCNKVIRAPLNVVKSLKNRRNNPDFMKVKQLDLSKFVYCSYCRTIKVSRHHAWTVSRATVRKRKFTLTEIIFTVFTRVNVCKDFPIWQCDKQKSCKKNNDNRRFTGTAAIPSNRGHIGYRG